MCQFFRNRRICLLVVVTAATGACWLQAELLAERPNTESEASATEGPAIYCLECQEGGLFVPQNRDPAIDQAYREAFHETMRARSAAIQRRHMEEAQRKLREKQKIWQGTTAELSRHPQVTDAQRDSAVPFVELFERDLPAPKVRREYFAPFLKPDSPDRCVGWRILLKSAEEVDDGWLVDVDAGVNLLGSGCAICSSTTKEIWHVSRKGELTFVEGSPGKDEPARVNFRL